MVALDLRLDAVCRDGLPIAGGDVVEDDPGPHRGVPFYPDDPAVAQAGMRAATRCLVRKRRELPAIDRGGSERRRGKEKKEKDWAKEQQGE